MVVSEDEREEIIRIMLNRHYTLTGSVGSLLHFSNELYFLKGNKVDLILNCDVNPLNNECRFHTTRQHGLINIETPYFATVKDDERFKAFENTIIQVLKKIDNE